MRIISGTSQHPKDVPFVGESRQKLNLLEKIAKCVLCHPLGELGVTYTVHLWLVGKCVVDFLLVLTQLFFASSDG